MSFHFKKKLSAVICTATLILGLSVSIHAETDYKAEAEARKTLPIQTNEISGWPQGPQIGAESAILMDADTGIILYAKNIDEQLYPASTTKILTCLIAMEKCELNETVTFSNDAVFGIERGSSNIGMDVGESITMEEALRGILILSANEVAAAVAEHISGSQEAFAELMNQRAAELGCKNSHFVNPNGLHNDEHYTSAYDLATIARSFFSHELLCNISSSTYCTFEATDTQPDSFTLATKNQLVKGKEYEYECLVGSKTGYTSKARQTLVSCAKKDGMKLICVIMKEESPCQFTDTVDLFQYGFDQFEKIKVADYEKRFDMQSDDFFRTGNDVFGTSKPVLNLNPESTIIIPKQVAFEDLTMTLNYDNLSDGQFSRCDYSYHGIFLGSGSVDYAADEVPTFEFSDQLNDDTVVSSDSVKNTASDSETAKEEDNIVIINVRVVVYAALFIIGFLVTFVIVRTAIRNYSSSKKRRAIMKRHKKYHSTSEFKDYDF